MNDVEIISKIGSILRSKKVFWIEGEYLRGGERVRWECFVKLWKKTIVVGFDEYLEKYEDAVDLYDACVRNKFSNIEMASRFVLDSFPLAAEKMRQA